MGQAIKFTLVDVGLIFIIICIVEAYVTSSVVAGGPIVCAFELGRGSRFAERKHHRENRLQGSWPCRAVFPLFGALGRRAQQAGRVK